MKNIYQIGRHRLHVHDAGLAHESRYESRFESTELLRSPYSIPQAGRWIFKNMTISISGMLMDVKNKIEAEQLAQILRSEIDLVQDIIAYDLGTSSPPVCACQYVGDMTWLHNVGMIRDVTFSRGDAFDLPQISLEIELLSFWEPLNMLVWNFGYGIPSPLDSILAIPPYRDLVSDVPPSAQVFSKESRDFSIWRKRNFDSYNFLYDPMSWEVCHQPNLNYSLSWTPGGWRNIRIPQEDWGGPPRVMYAFTNLPETGTVTIRTVKESGWSHVDETITIDLETLDTDLSDNGYGGLRFTDQVIIGDVTRLPGYIRRNETLLSISPRVSGWGSSINSYWPGMLNPGENRILLDPAGGMVAYHIVPRRM